MADLFATGHVIDIILGLMLLEALASVLASERYRRASGMMALFCNLAAGAGLLLALRAAILHAAWPSIAVWLIVALVAHVGEVSLRWLRPVY